MDSNDENRIGIWMGVKIIKWIRNKKTFDVFKIWLNKTDEKKKMCHLWSTPDLKKFV